ncbi:MAG: hypothetical protein M4579_001422 [Chaenotheca gracillima]|nr:MAG: hypothetical protein M4579_001422 [Chaenotheca gracillima]
MPKMPERGSIRLNREAGSSNGEQQPAEPPLSKKRKRDFSHGAKSVPKNSMPDELAPEWNIKQGSPGDPSISRRQEWEDRGLLVADSSKDSERNDMQGTASSTAVGTLNADRHRLMKPSHHPATSASKGKAKTRNLTASQPSFFKGEKTNLAEKARALIVSRKALPIWERRKEIRECLRERDILLVSGETGSGKSTQIPQFLVTEPWCQTTTVQDPASNGKGRTRTMQVGGCIAVTEPRRVAAISLARRVATEMGTPLGANSPASKVGYSVRFDNSTSQATRIKYVTEGMLLQELLRDPWLRQYSAVVVDEIHERGVNVDLAAGFLRKLVTGKQEGRGGVPLKVIVMSATADVGQLYDFFASGFAQSNEAHSSSKRLAGSMGGVTTKANAKGGQRASSDLVEASQYDGSDSSWSGFSDEVGDYDTLMTEAGQPQLPPTNGNINESTPAGSLKPMAQEATKSPKNPDPIGICQIEGRQFPVHVHYESEPVSDIIDATLRTALQIHHSEALPGDILIFLTGQDEIETLEKLVLEQMTRLPPNIPKIAVLPLFAALPQHAQQKVFQPIKAPHTRKFILSTNIAETSVTVPGVRHVVDCGKAKIKHFRARLGLDSLLAKPISKSSAVQRTGRAGREAPGKCFRLYTEDDFLKFEPSTSPEMLRSDLVQIVLMIKARGVHDILSFPFLTPPPRESLEKALLQLHTLQALTAEGQISALGRKMAGYPLPPSLSRVLLAAAEPEVDCLAEMIDIISCLTVENIFLNLSSEEKKELADVARKDLVRREGDHLTLLSTVQKYSREHSDRRAWCEKHFVSHRAMQAVMDVRKQLRAYCTREKLLVEDTDDLSPVDVSPHRTTVILRCFLKGFAAKTARLSPDGSYKTMIGNHAIAIHPSSGLFGRRTEAIMYNEYLFTNKSYAKCVSAVQLDWIGEALES